MNHKDVQKITLKLIKLCHKCHKLTESHKEEERCPHCSKAFLPSNYFEKIHFNPNTKLRDLYSPVEEIEEHHLIFGLQVKW